MFEDYEFEGVFIATQPVLALYAQGQLSFIVKIKYILAQIDRSLFGYDDSLF